MDQKTAQFLAKSLISRLVDAGNGQWKLQGTVTSLELQALKLLVEESKSNPDMDECKKSKQPASVNVDVAKSSKEETTTEPDHADFFSTKLSEYVLPSTLDSIKELLLRELGDNATLAHLIKTSSKELKGIPTVGEKKLAAIRTLQQSILDGKYHRASNANGIHQRVKPAVHETQDDRNIEVLGDNASHWQLIETSDLELQKTPRLGKKALATASTMQRGIISGKHPPTSIPDDDKASSQRVFDGPSVGENKLRALQRDVLDGKYHPTSKSGDQTSGQRRFDGLEDVPMDELELVLLEDVEQFINQLDQISRYIFASRIGWKTPLLTLEEIGKTLQGGSRERIRQIQKQLSNDLVDSLRVSPKTLWINLKSSMSLRGAPLFPRIRDCFTQEKDFHHFLENCCNGTDCKIISITKPSIGNAILDDFWAESISPVHFSKLVDYLQSEHGYEHAVAENALIRLQERGVLDIRGEQIAPRQLSKPLAVAHLLLHSPEPMFWKAIHEKVNHLGISKTPFSLERQDSVLDAAVVYGWFYQSGQGEYRSLSHLNLSEQEIEATLFSLKKCLEEAKGGGRDTINLAMDFYGRQPQSLDYFIVRHIACAYGEREGIFFSSKSGADTVSLDTKFTLASQEEIILQAFVKAGGALTKHEIAITIRSHSAIHAGYYLDRLIKSEKVVRVSAVKYALSAKAFESFNIPEKINIPRIVKSAATFLAEEPRPVEGEILQRHLNRKFSLEKNKYLYLSLLRIHAARLGYNWYYSHNLVSKFPEKDSNVTELYRQVAERCIQ